MRFLTCIFLLLVLFGCERQTKPLDKKLEVDTSQLKVVVLCEGNFMWGNASIDVFYSKTGTAILDVYKKQNDNKPLGDVLQSGYLSHDLLWLVVNNSGKIVGVNAQNYKWVKSITGLRSPRYMAELNGKYWITDLYDNRISIVDTNTLAVTKKIYCKGWSEQIVPFQNHLYVANANGFLYDLDAIGEKISDSIVVPKGAKWACKDKQDNIWVLSSDSGKSYLSVVSTKTNTMQKQMAFPKDISASSLRINKAGDSLFYVANGVFALSISASAIPTTAIYQPLVGENIYGLSVNPFSGNLYLCNAKDFTSKGNIVIVSSKGAIIGGFDTGIIPGSCMFYY